MSLVVTYTVLLAELELWLERNGDAALRAQGPYIFNLAEDRLARELKILGVRDSVTASFTPGQSWVPKPVRWRETDGINMGTGPGYLKRKQLYLRDYHFCRGYWPNPQLTGEPRFYADYLYNNLLVTPTPDAAYPFEFLFFGRAAPLDATHQTNWWTLNAPAILHHAVMLEARSYTKDYEGVKLEEEQYDRAIKAQFGEQARIKIDGATEVNEKR